MMKVTQELYDRLCKLKRAELDERGRELVNPLSLEVPSGYKRPESLQEQIKRLIRTDLSYQAALQGHETFEEANDFDCGEDDEPPKTYHEMVAEYPMVDQNGRNRGPQDKTPVKPEADPADPPADQKTEPGLSPADQ